MEIWVYAFDFEKGVKDFKKKYEEVTFQEYANKCIYNIGCKAFMKFNDIPNNNFNWKKFVDSTCMNIFGLARTYFLQNEDADVMIAYRLIDKNSKKDYVFECL